jgi:hypothetical protein
MAKANNAGFVTVEVPADRVERLVKMLKTLDWLEKNDPARHAEAMRFLAEITGAAS